MTEDSRILSENILPFGGEAYYCPDFVPNTDELFQILLSHYEWKPDEVVMYGKRIFTQRKIVWVSDHQTYTYAGTVKTPQSWTPELWALKEAIEQKTGRKFNACLMNLYADGSQSMGWHRDNEPEIVSESCIASISLGQNRRFCFKHKQTGTKAEVVLTDGSLLCMMGQTQENWLHALPKSTKATAPRMNLTFRLLHEG